MSYGQATENLVCKACRGKIEKGEWYESDGTKSYHLDCANLKEESSYAEYEEDDKEFRRRQRREEREAKNKALGWVD